MSLDKRIIETAEDKRRGCSDAGRSISSHSSGVRHLPQADIESIRDVLRGYGSPGGILKELIQNAEDAKAKRVGVFFLPADPAASQSLLRSTIPFRVFQSAAFVSIAVLRRQCLRRHSPGTRGGYFVGLHFRGRVRRSLRVKLEG
jgi:hypothetical protein